MTGRILGSSRHDLQVTYRHRPLTAHGLGFTLIISVLAAWICTHLGV